MTSDQALAVIQDLAQHGQVDFAPHAIERAGQRGATRADVIEALLNATECGAANEPDRWRVGGRDLDGDELTVICVIEGGVVVITVF